MGRCTESLPDPIDRGTLSGADTSVRAHWRIDAVPTIDDTTRIRVDAPTLIRVRLENPDPVEQRVSLRNQLDGPVLFPRSRGVPEAGWDREGFVGSVSGEGVRALGYACPAPIERPPIELTPAGAEQGPNRDRGESGHNDDHDPGDATGTASPAAVVRKYGGGTPPAAVSGCLDSGTEQRSLSATDDPTAELPSEVTAWLDDIENRIAEAERLEEATLQDATAVLRGAGGLDQALARTESLPTDAERLRELAARATALAERADDVDVPVTALRRLT